MSIGCGTLGGPQGFRIGNLAASISNGKQHTLPKNPAHFPTDKLDITNHWESDQPKGPTRLWGSTKSNKLGGEDRIEGPDLWLKGEFWNVDSNIRAWGEHETRRNAASAAHDVHRHDMITRVVLPPVQGSGLQESRQCVSGVVSADSCFLEAWGFSLGRRDRQARPATLWKPANADEAFRAERSYNRNIGRLVENSRSLRRTATVPGSIHPPNVVTLKPEDVGGEAGDLVDPDDVTLPNAGKTHGSRSCQYWDRYDHVVNREGAKMSCSIHSPSFRAHPDGHIVKENTDLSPAAVYTLKFRKQGQDAYRKRTGATELTKQMKEADAISKGQKLQKTLRLGSSSNNRAGAK